MITKSAVNQALKSSRDEFNELWAIFLAFHGEAGWQEQIADLPHFQIKLFEAIAKLEDVYRQIRREEKDRVSRKSEFHRGWFVQRMRALARYKEHVADTLKVGRAIGDGFAWWFYENDRDMIGAHAQKQKQKLLPPRGGRRGEEFVLKKMQSFDGKLLIYHGNTNFLRVGDFSVFDLNRRRIVGLVEVKTSPLSDTRGRLSLNIISGEKLDIPSLVGSDWHKTTAELDRDFDVPQPDPIFEGRLNRQVSEMGNVFSEELVKPQIRQELEHQNHHPEIKRAIEMSASGSTGYQTTSSGGLFAAIPIGEVSSTDVDHELSPVRIDTLASGLPAHALEIMIEGRDDNSLICYTLNNSADEFGPRRLPLQFWNIGTKNLRKVIFNEVFLMAAFNPAHLHRLLERKGFAVNLNAERQLTSASLETEGRRLSLEAFRLFYLDLATGALSLKAVDELIDRTMKELKASPHRSQRLDLDLRIARFGPPEAL